MADDPRDLARGLISSEPFMVIPSLVAQGGQKVQDAWDTIKSHVEDLANKAVPTLEAAGQSVSQALTPTVPTSNQPEAEAAHKKLTSAEFAASIKAKYPVYKSVPDEELTAKMLQKYPTYQDQVEAPPAMDWRSATGKGQVIFSNKVLAGATENAPAIGGAIGGVMGGVPGAVAGGAAGSLVKAAIQRPEEAVAHPLQTAGYAAAAGVGQGALEGAGQMVPKALTAGAKAVYRSYLKPSLSLKLAPKAEQIVNTALNEALPITKSGANKAQQIITALNQQVQDVLDNSSGTVDLHDVADRLRMWATKTFYKPGAATADLESAMKVADSIDQHASQEVVKQVPVTKTVQSAIVDESGKPFTSQVTTTKPVTAYRSTVPVGEAQETKQILQKSARNAYGTQSSATTTAQKVGGSLTRQAIEDAAPGVIQLNAREAKLIDAAKAINRAVGREANQYKLHGGKALVGAAVGGEELARTGSPYLAALKGIATTTILQPGIMSRAAIVASRLGRMSGIAPTMAARIAVAAVQSEMGGSEPPPDIPASNVVQVGPYRVEPQ